ncbi:MAG: hypothetical protein J0L55_15345 [Caulobacterales bacterium]|nr:hypothetical protein [Caulobacterales bacterium]
MSKYQPLQDYLANSKSNSISMTFSEIERILGFKLPQSSHKYRAWWSNNASNNVMTEAWLNAGFITADVDLEGGKLKFNLKKMQDLVSEKLRMPPVDTSNDNSPPPRAPFFGALKDQMVILPDVDFTESLWPEPEDDYDVFA